MFAFRGRVNSPYNSPNLSTATRSPVGFANEYHKYGRNGHFESILRVRLVVQRRNSDRSWLLGQRRRLTPSSGIINKYLKSEIALKLYTAVFPLGVSDNRKGGRKYRLI